MKVIIEYSDEPIPEWRMHELKGMVKKALLRISTELGGGNIDNSSDTAGTSGIGDCRAANTICRS